MDVEVGQTAAAAAVAKKLGARHAAVISAQGANAGMWVPSTYIHPLLYVRTMGEKEMAVQAAEFASTSIFRPGMLNRLRSDRM